MFLESGSGVPFIKPAHQELINGIQEILFVVIKKISAHDKALLAARLATDKKGRDVVLIDMRATSVACDWFVIASAASSRRIQGITKTIGRGLLEKKCRVKRIEGRGNQNWVLMDFGDVIIHVFHDEVRGYYGLEKLWSDMPKEEYDERCMEKSSTKTCQKSS